MYADYAAGVALKKNGVVFGGDMTPEAALTKLSYVLAKEELTMEEKRDMMRHNLRGELSVENIAAGQMSLRRKVRLFVDLFHPHSPYSLHRHNLKPNLAPKIQKSSVNLMVDANIRTCTVFSRIRP